MRESYTVHSPFDADYAGYKDWSCLRKNTIIKCFGIVNDEPSENVDI